MSEHVAEFLAEQKRLAEAATKGPWVIEKDHHRCYLHDEDDCEYPESPITERCVYAVAEGDIEDAVTHIHESYDAHQIGPDVAGNYDYEEGGIIHTADAEFIAAARSSVPRMIAALEAVMAEHYASGYWLGGDPAEVYERDADGHLCLTCSDESIADALENWEFDPSLAGWESWPCPTIRAIEAALGGEGE